MHRHAEDGLGACLNAQATLEASGWDQNLSSGARKKSYSFQAARCDYPFTSSFGPFSLLMTLKLEKSSQVREAAILK